MVSYSGGELIFRELEEKLECGTQIQLLVIILRQTRYLEMCQNRQTYFIFP